MLNKTSGVNDNIIEVRDEWKGYELNSFYKESEKVDIAINALSKHRGNDVTIEDVGNTSIGINGWYEEGMKEKTLLQKMKEIKTKVFDKKEDDEEEEIETEVVDKKENDEEEGEIETEVVENPDDKKEDDGDEEEIETEVVENPDDKKEDDGEETEDLTEEEEEEEEEVEIEIITYYKKEYYIITGEEPQYIYMIENGELGDKVGEVNGSKKIFYKSSKN